MFGQPKYETKPIEHIQDPNTGEMIHRFSLPPECIANIEKSIQAHSATMNQFVQNSATYFDLLNFQIELQKKVKLADEDVKKALHKTMKDCKLDTKLPYAWNMVLRCFEYRTPPTIPGMNAEELKASSVGSYKPIIKDAGGVGVS